MTDQKLKHFYHVFADNYDEYFTNLKTAKKHFYELKNAGYENIKLYQEDGYSAYICLKSLGEFYEVPDKIAKQGNLAIEEYISYHELDPIEKDSRDWEIVDVEF